MSVLRNLLMQGVDALGVVRTIRTDSAGRQKVSLGQPDPVVGTLAAVGDLVSMMVDGFSSITFFYSGATFAGATIVQEISPDSTNGINGTWFPLQASNSNNLGALTSTPLNSATNTSVPLSSVAHAPGATWVRVRALNLSSGTVTVRLVASASSGVSGVGVGGSISASPTSPTTFNLRSANTINATGIATVGTSLIELTVFNPSASTVFLKFYNQTAVPAPATHIPVMTIPIAAGESLSRTFGSNGKRFGTGLGIVLTGAAAETDTTVVAAGIQLSITRM